MGVSANIKCQSKTNLAVNSTSSSAWQLSLRLEHISGSDTTNISDVEIYIGVNHYWVPSGDAAKGIRVDVFNNGNSFGGATGTITGVTATFDERDDPSRLPILYPHGVNAKVKTVIKLTFTGTGAFTGTGQGFQDINISIRANNNRQTKYFDGSTDVEDSYSYRDNAGAAEVSYADNAKIWVKDSSAGSALRWGTEPDYTATKLIVIEPLLAPEIREDTPATSYESATLSNIRRSAAGNKRSQVLTFQDPSVLNVGTILHAECVIFNESANFISNGEEFDLVEMNVKPDNNPTWNESAANRGPIKSTTTAVTGFQFTQTGWRFSSASLETLMSSWLSNFATNHKGVALKFKNEGTTSSMLLAMRGRDDPNAGKNPRIFVAYVEAPSRRRIITF